MKRLLPTFSLFLALIGCAVDEGSQKPAADNIGVTPMAFERTFGTLPLSDISYNDGELFGLDMGGYVVKWNWTNNDWDYIGGQGNSIAANALGSVWLTNQWGSIFRGDGFGNWEQMPGYATAVSAGGLDTYVAGGGVYRWENGGWADTGLSGISQIAVDPWGFPWAVGQDMSIWRNTGSWQWIPTGAATSIGVTRQDGIPYVIGSDGQTLFEGQFDEFGNFVGWEFTGIIAKKVSPGERKGDLYVLDAAGIAVSLKAQRIQECKDAKPPGTCSPEEYGRLNKAKKLLCRLAEASGGCTKADTCETALAKDALYKACQGARRAVMERCFCGGDSGHLDFLYYVLANTRSHCGSRIAATCI